MLTRASSQPSHRARAAHGFTLIELAVAITLLGVLMALALPSFTSWIRNTQVRTTAEALQSGIRRAQADAVRLNQPVVMSLTNDQPALNANAVANGKNWSIQTITQFDRAAQYVTGGTLSDTASTLTVTSTVTSLCFNSNGRLVANASPGVPGGTCTATAKQFDIAHASGDRPLRVLVAIGGQVRMCDPKRPTLSPTSPDGCP